MYIFIYSLITSITIDNSNFEKYYYLFYIQYIQTPFHHIYTNIYIYNKDNIPLYPQILHI